MSLIVSENSGTYFLVPEGQYNAVCVGVIDLGTQQSQWGTKKQLLLQWELPEVKHVFDEDRGEEPAVISRFFTASLNEKSNLRAFLESWRSKSFTSDELKGFAIDKLLGQPCILTVVHTHNSAEPKAVPKVAMKLAKGGPAVQATTPLRKFTFDDPSVSDYENQPEWIRKKIAESSEYASWISNDGQAGGEHVPPPDDDIPF